VNAHRAADVRPSNTSPFLIATLLVTTVFYSWQSDLPNAINRSLIGDALERACKAISNDWQVDAAVDRDTQGIPGSPDISESILSKIDASACFVGDVTLIDKAFYAHLPQVVRRWLSSADPAPNPTFWLS
jgi:hypothetical protein